MCETPLSTPPPKAPDSRRSPTTDPPTGWRARANSSPSRSAPTLPTDVSAGYGTFLGHPSVDIRVVTRLPLSGWSASESALEVSGHAAIETLDELTRGPRCASRRRRHRRPRVRHRGADPSRTVGLPHPHTGRRAGWRARRRGRCPAGGPRLRSGILHRRRQPHAPPGRSTSASPTTGSRRMRIRHGLVQRVATGRARRATRSSPSPSGWMSPFRSCPMCSTSRQRQACRCRRRRASRCPGSGRNDDTDAARARGTRTDRP